jgi:hypothetical protein
LPIPPSTAPKYASPPYKHQTSAHLRVSLPTPPHHHPNTTQPTMSFPPSPLIEFPLFTSLPSELRLKIYKQALHPVRMYKVLAFLVLPDEKHNNSKRVRNISLCSLKRSKTKTKTIPDPTPRVQATGYWTAGIRGGAKQQQRGKKAIPLPPSKEKRTSNAHANTMELALSAACTESRTVFLEQNRYSLLAEQKKGLIRFGKEDIIYICKLSSPLSLSIIHTKAKSSF